MSTIETQDSSTSRRRFLKAAGTIAAFHIVPRHVLGGRGFVPPSETVNVALVGAGGRGHQNARDLMKLDDVRITCIADPAETWNMENYYYKAPAGRKPVHADIEKHYGAKQSGFRCKEYTDFRKMLDNDNSLDAILCATPDHLHATVSLATMRLGKHIYCEKPLTHNVAEARLVAKVAKETGVATQMGNQGHSNEGIRQTVEWIQAGAIGTVKHVHAWVPATRWIVTQPGAKLKPQTIPAGFEWDLWLGPRAERPFHSNYTPVAWRDHWDFGCGAMGDFGCHDLDSACWALDLDSPTTVEMHPAGHMTEQLAPYGEIGYFGFAAKGDRPALNATWYSGGLQPKHPEQLPAGTSLPSRGVMFEGERGILVCKGAGGDVQLYPESRDQEFQRPEPTIPRSPGHHREWIDAIKGGPQCASNFEYGARLTEITLLGVASLRARKRLEFDAATMTAKGMPELDPIFHGTYRPGWELS